MTSKRRSPRITLDAALWIAVLGFVGYGVWPQAAAALGMGSGGTEAPISGSRHWRANRSL